MNKSSVIITGASGYIGRHLLEKLSVINGIRIKILSRSKPNNLEDYLGVIEVVEGDLNDPESLRQLLEPDCIVVNLVYLWGKGKSENLAVTNNILNACVAADVRRIIHVSTAAVTGRVQDNCITEDTICNPVTEYGITKYHIENEILSAAKGHFDSAILRPTAVYGPGGEPLKKLAGDILNGSRFRNYLKSCLFGTRKMNLVHVENVVAALLFLIDYPNKLSGEIFIVSDDDNQFNNFSYVEDAFFQGFKLPYYKVPRVQIPLNLLKVLLFVMGRNNINPSATYAPGKLLQYGFNRPIKFEDGLYNYIDWYYSTNIARKGGAI